MLEPLVVLLAAGALAAAGAASGAAGRAAAAGEGHDREDDARSARLDRASDQTRLRLAGRPADRSRVVRQVGEGDVGRDVVLVFVAVAPGRASLVLAETRAETAKAYRAVRCDVTVS